MTLPEELVSLKTSTAWSHLLAIDRAVEIVESWPEWKREVEIFPGEDNHE